MPWQGAWLRKCWAPLELCRHLAERNGRKRGESICHTCDKSCGWLVTCMGGHVTSHPPVLVM